MHNSVTPDDIEQEWQEFWVPIVMPNGVLDIEQVKKELYDFSVVMHEVAIVYDVLTCGRISKITTYAQSVIEEANECYRELQERDES